jgi:hypothetical protein
MYIIRIDQERLHNLLNEYGYQFTIKEKFLLDSVMHFERLDNPLRIEDRELEIAQFVKFLRLCGDNSYKITSTIKHSQQGKLKNSPESFTLEDRYIITAIRLIAEEMLHRVDDGFRDYCWGWDEKPKTKETLDRFEEFEDFKEPYSDEELNQIIEYRKGLASKEPSGNAEKGRTPYYLYNTFREAGFFGHSKQKEYCFLYDWCVLAGLANDIGKGYSGTIGKEKYQQIKNWITAYEKFINSLKLRF